MKYDNFQQTPLQDFADEIEASKKRGRPKDRTKGCQMNINSRIFDRMLDVMIQQNKFSEQILIRLELEKKSREELKKQFEEIKNEH